MILLDTNILSELMRSAASSGVIEWLDQQNDSDLYICAITRSEIELGLRLLPGGQRRDALQAAAQAMFGDFTGRCLPFGEAAAVEYARLVAKRQQAGRPISVEDAQIASIAIFHDMSLATRNTSDFSSIDGLDLINPWD